MNKTTVALTKEQFENIIHTLKEGGLNFRPNERVATALTLEANLGIRISDILKLKLNDFKQSGERYYIDIVEQKTGKVRKFTVPTEVYRYMKLYCLENNIEPDERMFPITERNVQKQLRKACDYCEYKNISTHSFRKFFATEIYKNNGYDIMLVKHLLQHSSASTTQRYIGLDNRLVENALEKHLNLP